MKKTLLLLAALAACVTANSQTYRLTGKIKNLNNGDTVYLEKPLVEKPVAYAVVKKGTFILSGPIDSTSYYYLKYQPRDENTRQGSAVVYLDGERIEVFTGDDNLVWAKGTLANDAHRSYFRQLDSLYIARKTPLLGMDSKEKPKAEREKLARDFARIENEICQLTYKTVRENINNGLGLNLMGLYMNKMTPEQWDKLFAIAPEFYHNDQCVMNYKRKRDAARKSSIGKPYMDMEMTRPDGSKVRLSDYVSENKLTMIDVWVGWCCDERKPEIDILKDTYRRFHDEGLEIVGVSLDTDADTWKKAIGDYELPWPQLCDFGGNKSQIVSLYGLTSFPQTYLINQDGLIIAKGFRDKKIMETVERAVKDSFAISGTGNGLRDGDTVSLYCAQKQEPVSQAIIKNGKFEFSGKCDRAMYYYLVYNKNSGHIKDAIRGVVFLELGDINVKLEDNNTMWAYGTPLNDSYTELYKKLNALNVEKIRRYNIIKSQDEATNEDLGKEVEKQEQQMTSMIDEAAKENFMNLLCMYLMAMETTRMTPALWDKLFEFAPKYYLNHKSLTDYANKREAARLTAVGKPFIDIEMQTPEGKTVKLSEYVRNNKVTMLDFWASWCGPCCAEIPAMKAALEQYREKGFNIVGVSLDSKADAWNKAIEKYQITWPQMSDLKGFACEGARLYDVTAIPATFLIDQNGIIVAKNVRGVNIAIKVGELLK